MDSQFNYHIILQLSIIIQFSILRIFCRVVFLPLFFNRSVWNLNRLFLLNFPSSHLEKLFLLCFFISRDIWMLKAPKKFSITYVRIYARAVPSWYFNASNDVSVVFSTKFQLDQILVPFPEFSDLKGLKLKYFAVSKQQRP